MPLSDLFNLCADFILERYPDAQGDHLADLMAAARSEAKSFVRGTHHVLYDQDIRSHLQAYFNSHQVEPGHAVSDARANWYRHLCSVWASDLDTWDLLSEEVAFAVDVAVSNARAQMKEGRWLTGDPAKERLHWLLRQAITRQRQAVRRQNM